MKLEEIPTMPLGAREEMVRITDTEVDGDPEIQSWLTIRADLEKERAAAAEVVLAIRTTQQDARAAQEAAQAEIDAIQAARPSLARQIVLGEVEDGEDARQQDRAADLRRSIALLRLGAAALDDDIREAERPVRYAVDALLETDMKLTRRRQILKAEMAYARWSAA